MPSFIRSVAVVVTVLANLGVLAQSQYNIDPSTVPIATRDSWCDTQKQSCPLICLQLPGVTSTKTIANNCTAETLAFSCICANGISPNASQYSQTIPYFECTEYGNQCVTACNGNSACQTACRTDNPCGAQDPVRINTTTSSAMPSTTAASSATGTVYNGLAGETAASGKKSSAPSILHLGQSYGLVVVLASMFAGFTLVM